MEILLLVIRLFLFSIFALAGIGKLLDLSGSKRAVTEFGVPDFLAKPIAILLPIAEIAIAIILIPAQTSWFGAIFGGILLLIFVAGMLWQMKQGNAPDCHCFGQIHSEPVSKKSLLRNIAFVVLAGFLVAAGKGNQGLDIFDNSSQFSDMNIMQVVFGLAVIGFMGAIVFLLKKISGQQTQIMRRIEVLELLSHEGGKELERDVTDPNIGLPIGSPAPGFELPDVNNKKVSFESFLNAGKSILLFFVSPSCNPCEAMIPEIEEWQKDLDEKINFVFISNGNIDENLDKFPSESFDHILLQDDNEIGEMFGSEWTPTVIFIDGEGVIASRPAAGDSAIKELIEKIKEEDLENEFVFIANGNGLKIGEKTPEFSLEDLEGNEISADYFQEKKTLVAYWSTGCPHCVNMMDELREWDIGRGLNEPNLLVISSGEADAHAEMELESPIVLDNDNELAGEFGMSGTPSAILVKNGKIASEVGVGADQFWALVGKRSK